MKHHLPLESNIAFLLAVFAATHFVAAEEPIDFDRDVRPILSEKCFHCHGPDAQTREADLRLDTREGLFADRGGYHAVVAGNVAASELYRRISTDDADERMPPADSGLTLTAAQQATLRHWIEQEAPWSGHWAFEPIARPELPAVQLKSWLRNGIDHFILDRLEREGLTPSPEADRATLIRRLTLDLTGLPPTPAEVNAFLQDDTPDAYARLVDRLLDSPHYGERMAWEWLDAARYADTDGFQGDPTRTMWPWRDWLVAALNDNMPFDQFTIEMLAGDLLPDATPEQILATGFNRNHMYNGEGGRIAEETRVENVFDRAETTSTVWLGLTMTCARCHDHKYDPISNREYFQLYAFFNNTSESGTRGGGKAPPVMSYLNPENRETQRHLLQQIAALKRKMDAPLPETDRAQQAWETEQRQVLAKLKQTDGQLEVSDWHVLGPLPAPGGDAAKSFDHDFGPEASVDLNRKVGDGEIAWRVEPNFTDGKVHPLSDVVGATYFYRSLTAPGERVLDLSLGSDDGIRLWLNGEQVLAKNVARAAAPDQERVQLKLKNGRNELLMKIVNTGGIAGFYFQKTGESVGGLPPEIAAGLWLEPEKRTPAQQAALRRHFRERHSPDWKQLDGQLKQAERKRIQLEQAAPVVMVMDELPEGKRRATKMLSRGLYNKPLEEIVTPGTPEFLPRFPDESPTNRLTLARWLMRPDHPLTARVTVNRYWQTFFGRGLVTTSEDFGRQGERPSHPQLLDWLAARFIDSGWDVKALHKLIVTSSTYRQASRVSPELWERDPENRLLARSPRYRMPSWMLRDQALALSGLLVPALGGPPVKPYQPEGIWAEATFGKIRYQPDSGEKLYRRSIYTFWRRIVGPTMFFDSAKRQTCEVKPNRTNTPLHALTTLNEPTFVEASRKMAERMMRLDETTPQRRIAWAFRLVTARPAETAELQLLTRRWEEFRTAYAGDLAAAKELLSVGESPRDESLDVAELAAYAGICATLLNLDEVLTRE